MYAYEEVLSAKHRKKTRASRTWQMIKRRGIIPAVERVVSRSDDVAGFTALVSMRMQDLAFEAVVIRHSEVFTPETVERAKGRLQKWKEGCHGRARWSEPMPKYGFNDATWETANAEGKAALAQRACTRDVIPYSDFIQHVRAITFTNAHDSRLQYFLEEISLEEDRAGRGMLTALVVHKHGDYMPGPGFFELARKLGRDTKDIEKRWIEEVNRVFASCDKPIERHPKTS